MLRYRILAHNDSILRYGYSINVTVSHTAGLGRARGRPLAEEMERETEAPAAVGFGQMIRDLGAVPSHGRLRMDMDSGGDINLDEFQRHE